MAGSSLKECAYHVYGVQSECSCNLETKTCCVLHIYCSTIHNVGDEGQVARPLNEFGFDLIETLDSANDKGHI